MLLKQKIIMMQDVEHAKMEQQAMFLRIKVLASHESMSFLMKACPSRGSDEHHNSTRSGILSSPDAMHL